MNHKTYAIINIDTLTQNMLEESVNSDKEYRLSLDKNLVILKFKIKHPNSLSGIKKYSHVEILIFLNQNIIQWNRDLPLQMWQTS